MISEGLRKETISYHIRTTVISPGVITSELLDSITDPDIAARMRSFITIMPFRQIPMLDRLFLLLNNQKICILMKVFSSN
ncbi:MAG: hypothetical protein ACL7BU_09190 [Candidatus Phlomobacter fragariae]